MFERVSESGCSERRVAFLEFGQIIQIIIDEFGLDAKKKSERKLDASDIDSSELRGKGRSSQTDDVIIGEIAHSFRLELLRVCRE